MVKFTGAGKGKAQGKGQWVNVNDLSRLLKQVGGGGKGGHGKGGKGKRNISMVRKAAKTTPEKCVWIGGLKERDTHKDAELNKKLKDWINKQPGIDGCKFVDIGPKGSGGAIFGDETKASAALSALSGKKFMGRALEVDVYVKGWKGEEE